MSLPTKPPVNPKLTVILLCASFAFLMVATFFMSLQSQAPVKEENAALSSILMAGLGAFMVVGAMLSMRGIGTSPEGAPKTFSALQSKLLIALAIIELPVLVSNFVLAMGYLDSMSRLTVVGAGIIMIILFVVPRALAALQYLDPK